VTCNAPPDPPPPRPPLVSVDPRRDGASLRGEKAADAAQDAPEAPRGAWDDRSNRPESCRRPTVSVYRSSQSYAGWLNAKVGNTVPLDLYDATHSGPPISWPPSSASPSLSRDWHRAPRLGSWRERAGEAEGVFLPLPTGRPGTIAGLAVTCNAMRRQRLAIAIGQVRSLPGDGRPGPRHPAARTSFAMS
jgi:hypothetical protein